MPKIGGAKGRGRRHSDGAGQRIGPEMVKVFEASENLRYLSDYLGTILRQLKLRTRKGAAKPGYELLDREKLYGASLWIRDHLKKYRPFIQCLDCKARGYPEPGCFCLGKGWLCEEEYCEWLKQCPASKLSTIEKLLRKWAS